MYVIYEWGLLVLVICWQVWILCYTLLWARFILLQYVVEVVNHWTKYLICTLHVITFAFEVMSPFAGRDLYRYNIIQCPVEGYDAHSYSVPWRGKSAEEHVICITYAFLACAVKWMQAMLFLLLKCESGIEVTLWYIFYGSEFVVVILTIIH